MKLRLLLLLTLWILGSAHAAIYRCEGPKNADGSANILYQAKPCPSQFESRELPEVKAPTLTAAESARIQRDAKLSLQPLATTLRTVRRTSSKRATSSSRNQSSSTRRRSNKVKFRNLPSVAHEGCPPTIENPGVYVVGEKWMRDQYNQRSKARNGMYAAWTHYKSLPSRTYLKNQGTWPAHCPD